MQFKRKFLPNNELLSGKETEDILCYYEFLLSDRFNLETTGMVTLNASKLVFLLRL